MSPPHPRDVKTIPALQSQAPEHSVVGGDSGTKEAKLLGRGLTAEQIRAEAAAGEHKRSERFRDHFEQIAIVSLYLAAVMFGLLAITWAIHLLAPTHWQYLTNEQLNKLQAVVTGGAIGVVVTHIKRRIS